MKLRLLKSEEGTDAPEPPICPEFISTTGLCFLGSHADGSHVRCPDPYSAECREMYSEARRDRLRLVPQEPLQPDPDMPRP
jgi:hypothetical protein